MKVRMTQGDGSAVTQGDGSAVSFQEMTQQNRPLVSLSPCVHSCVILTFMDIYPLLSYESGTKVVTNWLNGSAVCTLPEKTTYYGIPYTSTFLTYAQVSI